MKKNLFYFFCLAFIAVGCNDDDNDGPCHRPEGSVISQDFTVEGINELVMNEFGDFYITQGPVEDLTVKTYANIMDLVEVAETGDRLLIDLPGCYDNVDVLEYSLSSPDFEYIESNGAFNLVGDNSFVLDNLDVVINGVGAVDFEGLCDQLTINVSGTGDFNCYDLIVKECNIIISGVADIEISAVDKLNVTISGSGNVYYKGDPVITTNISGSGNVEKVD